MRLPHIALLCLAALAAMPARGDVFRLLDDPRDAAQARVDLIQQSTRQIDALYFLARNDRVTRTVLALLREARRRGVPTVRLVVDANFQHIPKAMLAHLHEEGVQVRVYHPTTLRHPSWMFRRMHEKVVIVDASRYIAGGRNLAEAYFGLAKKKNYVDRDVYVEGASAAAAQRHFENVWSSRHVTALHVRVSRAEKRVAAMMLDRALRQPEEGAFVSFDTGRDWSDGARDVASVRFLHDPVVPDDGPRVAEGLEELIAGARSSIVIESPYLVPSKSLLTLLERKLREGVSVLIVTNSLRSTDGVLPYAAYLRYRRRVVRAGIDVREYKGPDPLHAKSAVIDDRLAVVGSYNLDPRSQNLNTEVLCVAEDEGAARELRQAIDVHVANAWAVRSAPPRTPRSLRLWGMRLLSQLIENQL